nr:lysozyme inhibitor LprI family protein [Polaromonas naphthalenivorans]
MKTLKRFSAALAIAAASHAASAHETGLSKQHAACMDKSGGVTMGMIECITAENHRQDALLNKAYKALMAELPPPRKTQLQEAQRAWIKYRDANCAFYDDPDGGTLARVNANSCMMAATADRARELESFRQ